MKHDLVYIKGFVFFHTKSQVHGGPEAIADLSWDHFNIVSIGKIHKAFKNLHSK